MMMQLITWKPAPRGNKSCPGDCNTVGNCNHDSGLCECPAGWKGKDCMTVQKRPCTNLKRNPDDPTITDEPLGFIDEDGRDLNVLDGNSTTSRCFGTCDDVIGMCYCDGAFPQGRINAPKGSTPGTPPIRMGRPMTTDENQPRETKEGVRLKWGYQTYESMYGANGWCVAESPVKKLSCIIDGVKGPDCNRLVEHFCINQCNGHGSCYLGFCKCDPGWYGLLKEESRTTSRT